MKDELIERIAAELLSLGWFPTRHRESALSAAERILAIGLETAAAEADEYAAWHNEHDDGLSGFGSMATGATEVAARIRALSRSTEKEER